MSIQHECYSESCPNNKKAEMEGKTELPAVLPSELCLTVCEKFNSFALTRLKLSDFHGDDFLAQSIRGLLSLM